MEGVFIPVKDPELLAKWYEEIIVVYTTTSTQTLEFYLGFSLFFHGGSPNLWSTLFNL
jgi:hypothetical protein